MINKNYFSEIFSGLDSIEKERKNKLKIFDKVVFSVIAIDIAILIIGYFLSSESLLVTSLIIYAFLFILCFSKDKLIVEKIDTKIKKLSEKIIKDLSYDDALVKYLLNLSLHKSCREIFDKIMYDVSNNVDETIVKDIKELFDRHAELSLNIKIENKKKKLLERANQSYNKEKFLEAL